MLLDKLTPYHGINSCLSDESINLIDEFNHKSLQSINETLIRSLLLRIFKEVTQVNIEQELINELVILYYQKYDWLKLSSWDMMPSNFNSINQNGASPGFVHVDLTDSLTISSKDSIDSMIKYCAALNPDEQKNCILNLSQESSILQDINKALNNKYYCEMTSFLKTKNADKSFYALGQFKYHSKNSSKDSSTWHLDGDPRVIKLLLYLTDDPTNDGAFNISHWSTIYPDYKQCTFTDLSLMITLDSKLRLSRQFSQPPALLNHLLISDLVFGPLTKGGIPFKKTEVQIKKYRGVIFQGSTCIHAGGGNFLNDRPVLQLLLNCL